MLLVVSYSFIYLLPTDKLPFGLVFEEAVIVQLLLVYRLLLLGYVFFVCHQSITTAVPLMEIIIMLLA